MKSMTNDVINDRKMMVWIVILLVILFGFLWFIHYGEKPSNRILGWDTHVEVKNEVTRRVVLPFVEKNHSGRNGTLTIKEVNGMIVLQFDLMGEPSSSNLDVGIYKGSCAKSLEKKYTLPPIKKYSNVGWFTLYDVSWARLSAEAPLSVKIEQSQTSGALIACSDIRLE